MSDNFPIHGIAGLISEQPDQLDLARQLRLGTVEVRADLLLAAGHSKGAVLETVSAARDAGFGCLFTLRHPAHDGKFDGSESDRAAIYREALQAGAHIVDVEWDMQAAQSLLADGAPVILSHHDFTGMPSAAELDELTRTMAAARPAGIKIVPTGATLRDAATMLQWVSNADPDGPRRIGFTMGPEGACSRILTIAYGAPITYASFGAAVAPGQLPIGELVHIYRAHELDADTRVYGIAGNMALGSLSPFLHNPSFHARNINAVYVPLQTAEFDDITEQLDGLRIDGMSVTNPFKEAALKFADVADRRSTGCGASNTLVIERAGAARTVEAFNTDFDGVTIPIAQHCDLPGLRAAVIGNGGAARGAVVALSDAQARPTLFFRNSAKGQPVADELAVPGAMLSSIDASYDVYINATTLGARPGDPSPVPAAVFARQTQIAFDMCYQQPSSRFLDDAAQAGAQLVRGGEMLVAQGTVQFLHFTGTAVSLREFEDNFANVSQYR